MLNSLVFLVLACFAHGDEYIGSPMELSASYLIESTTFGLTGRIVNGTKAIFGQFPHQVSLRRSWSEAHFCGGSIMSDRLVITAAHCMLLGGSIIKPWTIIVVAGQLRLNDVTPWGQKRGVKAFRIHPEFNSSTLQNDIVILELSIPFAFTQTVQRVPLVTHDPKPETFCAVSGWGYLEPGTSVTSNDLMYVDLPIREQRECRELLANVTSIYPGMFCAGFLNGGKDACQGDSGGGMICDNILTGVVSGGHGCALPFFPGVYSNIFFYKDWIESVENEVRGKKLTERGCCNSCAYKTPEIALVFLLLVLSIMIGP
ncbi:trypsin alpha [Harpegnathos saltator]|uniref:Trypsin 3A1 n=1 Tax=Harpegnathos saltator TaxID=610380 RepID=E2BE68_HARSA|nr:trypsin alpha [Harpegnathos saltator]EFN86055.1 Trypsin 3A1 [Harpegnathos saltator]